MSPSKDDRARMWLQELIDDALELPRPHRPKPYYSQRQGSPDDPHPVTTESAARRVYHTVMGLHGQHFFSETVGYECVDGNGDSHSSPEYELERRVGKPELWKGTVADWDQDDLFDFIEVFHDLAARPTTGYYHSYMGCGWHPSTYSRKSGQALYRAQINEILDSAGLGFRLADEGEDLGRLVRAAPPQLVELVHTAVTTDGPERDEVTHAVALFRSRSGTRQEKRSAIVALAAVLEKRRLLLKDELLSKDESALFQIANQFDLRHRNAEQRGDYDEAFLDWVFHWYLATVHLCDQLLARFPR